WDSGVGLCTCAGVGYFIFFFQAEDGIRDLIVTGVQTCALPIWPRAPRLRRARDAIPPSSRGRTSRRLRSPRARSEPRGRRPRARSEERRVGKEGRSRWAPKK